MPSGRFGGRRLGWAWRWANGLGNMGLMLGRTVLSMLAGQEADSKDAPMKYVSLCINGQVGKRAQVGRKGVNRAPLQAGILFVHVPLRKDKGNVLKGRINGKVCLSLEGAVGGLGRLVLERGARCCCRAEPKAPAFAWRKICCVHFWSALRRGSGVCRPVVPTFCRRGHGGRRGQGRVAEGGAPLCVCGRGVGYGTCLGEALCANVGRLQFNGKAVLARFEMVGCQEIDPTDLS